MADGERLSKEEIEALVAQLRREHPHTYHVEGLTPDDDWIVVIRHADLTHNAPPPNFEQIARAITNLASG